MSIENGGQAVTGLELRFVLDQDPPYHNARYAPLAEQPAAPTSWTRSSHSETHTTYTYLDVPISQPITINADFANRRQNNNDSWVRIGVYIQTEVGGPYVLQDEIQMGFVNGQLVWP